jgi:hypothetical protein
LLLFGFQVLKIVFFYFKAMQAVVVFPGSLPAMTVEDFRLSQIFIVLKKD